MKNSLLITYIMSYLHFDSNAKSLTLSSLTVTTTPTLSSQRRILKKKAKVKIMAINIKCIYLTFNCTPNVRQQNQLKQNYISVRKNNWLPSHIAAANSSNNKMKHCWNYELQAITNAYTMPFTWLQSLMNK